MSTRQRKTEATQQPDPAAASALPAETAASISALADLNRISSRLWKVSSLHDGLAEILTSAIEILQADKAEIRLLDESRQVLRFAAAHGLDATLPNRCREVTAQSNCAAGQVLRTGRPVTIADTETDEALAPWRKLAQAAGIRAVHATGLVDRSGKLLGVLSAYFRAPHCPSQLDLERLASYAFQAGCYVEWCQVSQTLAKSEETLRAILATAVDAIITIDRRGIIRSVNPASERMFGYRASEMLGQNIKLLMPSPWREMHDDFLEKYDREKIAHIIGIGREVEGLRHDGTTFSADLAVSEIDHLGLYTGILRDTSQRKQLEREVVKIAALEQERIGQDLHDDCGQKLTALGLMADGVAESLRQREPEAAATIAKIEEGLRAVLRRIRHISRGLALQDVTPSELPGVLGELAARLSETSSVACSYQGDGPPRIGSKIVSTQLFHIAQEACTNAIRHARARNVQIRLNSLPGATVLEVQDDGSGIAKDSRQGLGIRIMRNRAKVIGAVLTIESARPRGTLVTCTLQGDGHAAQH